MEGNVSGYVCNHVSPNGERDTASPRLWAMLRTQASDEEADDVFSRRHLYCGTPVVTSWAVAGQQVVFLHMYLQTRVTLRAFPVATPRGRSVSFPIRGTMVTYVTWDDLREAGHRGLWRVGRGREPWERSEAGGVNDNERHLRHSPVSSPTEELRKE